MSQLNLLHNDWTPHPSEFIREELEARGWTQKDLAYILGRDETYMNKVLSGRVNISPEMAKALGEAFNVSAELFVNLQRAYDLANVAEPDPGISKRAKIQSQYPVREMIKRGWFENTDAKLLEVQVARFFEQSNIEDVPYLAHAAKKSRYEEKDIPPAQVAWLFRVKQLARAITVPKYSSQKLKAALADLTKLLANPEDARHVPKILMECGVRFILVESLPQSKIDGVCFWLDNDSPVIGMSFRFDRIDHFWFVLRHEIEHVLQKHGMEEDMIDAEMELGMKGDLPEEEKIANAEAAAFCVPPEKIESFFKRKGAFPYERDVVAFAKVNNRHPGLIVGQMQYRLNKYDFYRQYQVKIRNFILPNSIADGWGQVLQLD